MQKTPVLLLSPDEEVRQQWLKISADTWDTQTAKTLTEAQHWVKTQAGLVVVDAVMVDVTNTDWQQFFHSTNALVGGLAPNDSQGKNMILAGAKGYFHSYSPVSAMNTMLNHVNNGHIWIGQDLLSRLLSQVSSKLPRMTSSWQKDLTPREIEVAQRVALGHANQLIADDLQISERTVRAHLSSVFEKLDVNDRLMLTLVVHGVR